MGGPPSPTVCTRWSCPILISTPGETEHYPSSGTGLSPTFLATLWTTEMSYLSFCFPWCCPRGTEITDMDTLCSSSPASSTTRTREDPQTPALHRCPMDGDLSSRPRI